MIIDNEFKLLLTLYFGLISQNQKGITKSGLRDEYNFLQQRQGNTLSPLQTYLTFGKADNFIGLFEQLTGFRNHSFANPNSNTIHQKVIHESLVCIRNVYPTGSVTCSNKL